MKGCRDGEMHQRFRDADMRYADMHRCSAEVEVQVQGV